MSRTGRAFSTLAALLLLAPIARAEAESVVVVKGSYRVEAGVPVLRLWGTPHERGFAHGYLLADLILEGASRDLERLFGDRLAGYDAVVVPMMERSFSFSPAEREEMEGLLAGIRARRPEGKRRLEVLGRDVTLPDVMVMNTVGDWYAAGCSSAAVWGAGSADGTPSVVRNFDFLRMDLLMLHQHVRIVSAVAGKDARRGWVGLAHPGSIGVITGLNDTGVFAAIHDVPVRVTDKDRRQRNVPRLLALRRLLEELAPARACETALDRVRGWPTYFGNNFMIATPDVKSGLPAGVLEYDTDEERTSGAALRGPADRDGAAWSWVISTNHHRLRGTGSCSRYDALDAGCAALDPDAAEPWDAPRLFQLAARAAVPDADIPAARATVATLHQVVAFTGARKLWIRLIDPSRNIRDAKPHEIDVTKALAANGR